jgi:multiple sugar transport system permease protein
VASKASLVRMSKGDVVGLSKIGRRPWRARHGRKLVVLGFMAPWIVGFCVFIAVPGVLSFYYSFTSFDIFQAPQWVGFANYEAMVSDPQFRQALANTIFLVLIGVPSVQLFALFTGALLNLNVRGIKFYRTLYFLPAVMPTVPVVILWMWLFNPQLGLVNGVFHLLGLSGPGWMADPNWSKPVLIMLAMWQSGTVAAIYIAALKNVPVQLYEAAKIDGAGMASSFRHVTLPMISPVILFNTIIGVIWAFNYFTQAFIAGGSSGISATAATAGSPQGSLLFYSLYLYVNAFMYGKMGYACAMAWVLLLIVLVCTVLLLKSSSRWVHYES